MKSRSIEAMAAAFAVAASCAAGAASAAEKDLTQVERIIDRAIGLMAEARDYSVENDEVRVTTFLGSGQQQIVRSSSRSSFREPGILWADGMSSEGSRSMAWSDGQVLRQFGITDANDKDAGNTISEQPLLEGDYRTMGGHRFHQLSPLKGAAFHILMTANREGRFPGGKYLGRQRLRADECDVIQTRLDLQEAQWSQTRARFPQVPQKGARQVTMYLRVSDGRLLRLEESDWSMNEIDGKWPEPMHMNVRTESRSDYRYGPALPAQETDLAHFNAAVRGATGGKMPEIQRMADEWQGKSLPAINLATLDGKAVRWEDFRGKVLVIETWFIGCTYCKYAFPYYEKQRRKLENQGVVFMAFNTANEKTDGPAQIGKWMDENKEPFGFLWVRSSESAEAIGDKLKFKGAPLFFVVGPDGNIVASYQGFGYGNGGEDPRLLKALLKAGIEL